MTAVCQRHKPSKQTSCCCCRHIFAECSRSCSRAERVPSLPRHAAHACML